MHLELKHNLSKSAAATRVKQALLQAGPQLQEHASDMQQEWDGDTLSFSFVLQGNKIAGTLVVEDEKFILDAKLPLMWRLFEGKIERLFQDEIAKQLKQA